MTQPVSSIRNFGPASEILFARAGIKSAQQLRDIGADAAYKMVLQTGTRPHFIGYYYYALVMGLQGRPWNDCAGEEKVALRAIFDALVSQAHDKSRAKLEITLDKIGVIRRR